MKKIYYNISFLTLIVFFILGGIFGTLVFLPEMKSWYEAFPDAVRNSRLCMGFIVGLIQLIGALSMIN